MKLAGSIRGLASRIALSAGCLAVVASAGCQTPMNCNDPVCGDADCGAVSCDNASCGEADCCAGADGYYLENGELYDAHGHSYSGGGGGGYDHGGIARGRHGRAGRAGRGILNPGGGGHRGAAIVRGVVAGAAGYVAAHTPDIQQPTPPVAARFHPVPTRPVFEPPPLVEPASFVEPVPPGQATSGAIPEPSPPQPAAGRF